VEDTPPTRKASPIELVADVGGQLSPARPKSASDVIPFLIEAAARKESVFVTRRRTVLKRLLPNREADLAPPLKTVGSPS